MFSLKLTTHNQLLNQSKSRSKISERCAIYCIFEGEKDLLNNYINIDPLTSAILQSYFKNKQISGKAGELTYVPIHTSKPAQHVLVLGLGKRNASLNIDVLRQHSGDVVRLLRDKHIKQASFLLNDALLYCWKESQAIQAITEGLILGDYVFDRYKKSPIKKSKLDIQISITKLTDLAKRSLSSALSLAKYTNLGRDLANMPANKLTPLDFFDITTDQIKPFKHLTLAKIDKKEARSLGMEAFLGVAQGSSQEPLMLVLELNPSKEKPIVLVGKGVTFDSGGISIKSSKGMSEMKADMTGAAVVLASMLSLADQKSTQRVVALIPLVENMPSATAQRPGDIVKAMNGTSIEIINTDAEGRLIMADAICYANTFYKPNVIVDVATLTGAALVALGDVATGVFSNSSSQESSFKNAAKKVGECVWSLPIFDEFRAYMDSDVADIKNANENRLAGASTAAIFLKEFVEKTPWIHLDIAPTMSSSKTKGAKIKGMHAPCVNALVEYINNIKA